MLKNSEPRGFWESKNTFGCKDLSFEWYIKEFLGTPRNSLHCQSSIYLKFYFWLWVITFFQTFIRWYDRYHPIYPSQDDRQTQRLDRSFFFHLDALSVRSLRCMYMSGSCQFYLYFKNCRALKALFCYICPIVAEYRTFFIAPLTLFYLFLRHFLLLTRSQLS